MFISGLTGALIVHRDNWVVLEIVTILNRMAFGIQDYAPAQYEAVLRKLAPNYEFISDEQVARSNVSDAEKVTQAIQQSESLKDIRERLNKVIVLVKIANKAAEKVVNMTDEIKKQTTQILGTAVKSAVTKTAKFVDDIGKQTTLKKAKAQHALILKMIADLAEKAVPGEEVKSTLAAIVQKVDSNLQEAEQIAKRKAKEEALQKAQNKVANEKKVFKLVEKRVNTVDTHIENASKATTLEKVDEDFQKAWKTLAAARKNASEIDDATLRAKADKMVRDAEDKIEAEQPGIEQQALKAAAAKEQNAVLSKVINFTQEVATFAGKALEAKTKTSVENNLLRSFKALDSAASEVNQIKDSHTAESTHYSRKADEMLKAAEKTYNDAKDAVKQKKQEAAAAKAEKQTKKAQIVGAQSIVFRNGVLGSLNVSPSGSFLAFNDNDHGQSHFFVLFLRSTAPRE